VDKATPGAVKMVCRVISSWVAVVLELQLGVKQ
jgi:hypothetical protein